MDADAKREGPGAEPVKTDEKQAESGDAGENPLIPNTRLRQIYLAMVQARALEKALPAAKRGRAIGMGAKTARTLGMEACLVSTAADLGPDDLVSDALAGGAVEYLRGTALREVLRPGKAERSRKRRAGSAVAVCGAAGRLPGAADATERIWVALGAAAALKVASARDRANAKVEDTAEDGTASPQAGVVMVYTLPGEVTTVQWKKILKFTVDHELPMIFAFFSERGADVKTGRVSALAMGCGVPAILVDKDDAVAIYRVAQESIGHARIGGGAALIVCAAFVPQGAAGNARVTEDAIAGLERYLEQRGVATRAWMEREAKAFAKRLGR